MVCLPAPVFVALCSADSGLPVFMPCLSAHERERTMRPCTLLDSGRILSCWGLTALLGTFSLHSLSTRPAAMPFASLLKERIRTFGVTGLNLVHTPNPLFQVLLAAPSLPTRRRRRLHCASGGAGSDASRTRASRSSITNLDRSTIFACATAT